MTTDLRAVLVLAGLLSQVPLAAAVTITLPAASAAPGSSVFLPAGIAAQGDAVSSIQFDIEFDPAVMDIVAVPNEAVRVSGKTLYAADLGPGRKRFLAAGLNGAAIANGALAGLFANLAPNVPAGTYALKLSNVLGASGAGQVVTAAGQDGVLTVQGTLDQAVRLQPEGVMNGGSLLPGPVSAGEVITLIGSRIGPAQPVVNGSSEGAAAAGTAVTFDGAAAPLLYAGPNQINAIVPFAVYGRSAAVLGIAREGNLIAGLSLPVMAATPALFTMNSSGVGQGAILNQDQTLNSPANPASRGSIVVLFGTGAGQTDPAGRDGELAMDSLPKPLLPVSVQIAGIGAEVLYAGAAPGLIAGVLQVNCRIPEGASPGHAAPVTIRIGAAGSQPGVTLAIR